MKRKGFFRSLATLVFAPTVLKEVNVIPQKTNQNDNELLIDGLQDTFHDTYKSFVTKYGNQEFTTWMNIYSGDSETNF